VMHVKFVSSLLAYHFYVFYACVLNCDILRRISSDLFTRWFYLLRETLGERLLFFSMLFQAMYFFSPSGKEFCTPGTNSMWHMIHNKMKENFLVKVSPVLSISCVYGVFLNGETCSMSFFFNACSF